MSEENKINDLVETELDEEQQEEPKDSEQTLTNEEGSNAETETQEEAKDNSPKEASPPKDNNKTALTLIKIPDSYDEVNDLRWEMAGYLITTPFGYIIPLYPFDIGGELGKAGKVPIVKKWTARDIPTLEELEGWQDEDDFYNLGLILGSRSRIIAIDVDSVEGKKILHELSGGDLPDTVQYTTPGGGIRYLYHIPDEFVNNRFQKYVKKGTGEHSECALLGDGSQTVLPYSIHPNGGVYTFFKGKTFKDIEIADAPEWMIKLMIKAPSQINNNTLPVSSPSVNLKNVCRKCPKLTELLKEQKKSGLHEELWFLVMCLLIGAGHIELARNFSKLSSKHDARSDRRIDELVADNKCYPIRCTSLGCKESDISACFSKCKKNAAGDITNSPFSKINHSKLKNEKIGIWYDEDGNFTGINGNIFARFILKNYKFAYRHGMGYYLYTENYWCLKEELDVMKTLYNFFQKIVPDKWTGKIEEIYMDVFSRICPSTDSLDEAGEYINLKNGLFNLKTFSLEPHNDNIFITTQLPVEYDPNAKCPMFIDYLNDVLFHDLQMIELIQEMLGYCLCYETKAHKMFVLIGEGSNGKSVLCDILFELAGGENNVSTVSLGELEQKFKCSHIVGKTLNISHENEVKVLDTQMAKIIASGDPTLMERKYGQPFTYRPYTKLVFSMNRLPYAIDKSYGFERRLIIIPFDRKYVESPKSPSQGKINPDLKENLLTELNGIFNFAMEGLERLITNKYRFTKPSKMVEVLDEYKLEVNPYLDFVRDCIEPINPDKDNAKAEDESKTRIPSQTLREAFREWCHSNDRNKTAEVTMRTFLREFRLTLKNESIDYEEEKSNGEKYFKKIKLNDKAKSLMKKGATRKAMLK